MYGYSKIAYAAAALGGVLALAIVSVVLWQGIEHGHADRTVATPTPAPAPTVDEAAIEAERDSDPQRFHACAVRAGEIEGCDELFPAAAAEWARFREAIRSAKPLPRWTITTLDSTSETFHVWAQSERAIDCFALATAAELQLQRGPASAYRLRSADGAVDRVVEC